MTRRNQEKISFTLKVDAIRDGSSSKLKSRKSAGNKIYLTFDLNPHGEIGDTEDLSLNPEHIQEIFDFITKKLFPTLEKASKRRKQNFNKINRIVFRQNSPGTSEVSYVETYNGDMQPPPYFP